MKSRLKYLLMFTKILCRIYRTNTIRKRELEKLETKAKQTIVKQTRTIVEGMNRPFTKEKIQMTDNHVEK